MWAVNQRRRICLSETFKKREMSPSKFEHEGVLMLRESWCWDDSSASFSEAKSASNYRNSNFWNVHSFSVFPCFLASKSNFCRRIQHSDRQLNLDSCDVASWHFWSWTGFEHFVPCKYYVARKACIESPSIIHGCNCSWFIPNPTRFPS